MMRPIEEIKEEFTEWCIGLLKCRFELKDEYWDIHSHANFTYENAANCVWNAYIQPLLEKLEEKDNA